MPHKTIRLIPGANEVETMALNQEGVSITSLVRLKYDPSTGGILEKIGGWSRFFPNQIVAIVRQLLAWQDLDAIKHLAYGTQNIGNTTQAQLGVITNGSQQNITPTATTDNVAPIANTTAGNSTVLITDATVGNITSYDAVFIQTHLAVGNLVLYGLYPTIEVSGATYGVAATDILGNPEPAPNTGNVTVVANFTVTTGSNVINVNLPSHGYSVESTYPALVPTTVGNITIYGDYFVQNVVDGNNFTILGSNTASGNVSGLINGGQARYVYSFGVGAVPVGSGFGSGGFGSGGFGSGTSITPATGTPIGATDWSLDNWGEILLSLPDNGSLFQPIYQWDPSSGSPFATVITQAPTVSDGFFVAMPQRQIVAWGSTATGIQDPLLVNWCDVNNFNQWIATVTNQAGSYRIPRGSRVVGGLQAPNQGLLWTDIDLWSMQYIGPSNVYSFNQIGAGCGLIGRKAGCVYNDTAYWMGQSQFFMLTPASTTAAGGVSTLPCPIWDVIFQELDQNNLQKVRAAVNSRFGEITWYFPTTNSGGEVAMYVKFSAALSAAGLLAWDYGPYGRSAWIDQSVEGSPIGFDPASLYIYQHETSPDADGQPLLSSFQTGYTTLADGEYLSFIDQFWSDAKWGYYNGAQNATINLTFYGVDYPGQTPNVYGPYTLTQGTTFITPRIRNRLVSMAFSSSDIGTWWRMGAMRYRYCPDGKF